MIHLFTKGGIGNQMFQYAYAMQVQKLCKDKSICVNGIMHGVSSDGRVCGLHHFALSESTYICSVAQSVARIIQFAVAFIRGVGFIPFLKFLGKYIAFHKKQCENVTVKEEGICFTTNYFVSPDLEWVRKGNHVYGGFQHTSTIDGIIDDLRRAFTITTPASEENQKVLEEIQAQNAVCLHIRRGDYGLFPQLQVCNEAYYSAAVHRAQLELENPVFYVFSTGHDDIEWIKKNYTIKGDVRYVDLDNPDYEELRLMMACRHFIISNSTFSWWAAVLSVSAGDSKRVWAPAEWMRGVDVSIVPEGWTKLDNF